MFRQAENIEVDDVEHMGELLLRDINRIDGDRWEQNSLFTTPAAISPSLGGRSGIARYINQVVAAGHPLTVSLHSLATKVLFKKGGPGKKPKAYAVEYTVGEGLYSADGRYDASQKGQTRTVRARKEVIVSGGTFNTPQILKLSGVGPRKELRDLGIPVVVDLPAVVSHSILLLIRDLFFWFFDMHSQAFGLTRFLQQGNFMQDNYEVGVQVEAEEPWVTGVNPCTATFDDADPCFVLWRTNRTGPYTQRGGSFALNWRSSVSQNQDADLVFLSGAGRGGMPGFYPGYSQARRPAPRQWGTALVKMQTGNAAGTVRLRSKDPREAPEINFNYFSQQAEQDLDSLVEGIELMISVFDEAGVPYTVLSPNPEADIRQEIMSLAFSHHASSSCRMGPAGHKDYCVDSKFRVNGVDSLRVVDASVLPRVPGAMPNGPTYTISRKAYEAILEDA